MEYQNTFYVHLILENCAVYEIMWTNTVQPDGPQTLT